MSDPNPITLAWDAFKQAMQDDPEYAWAWHCNLAIPIMDAIGVSHERANLAAAHLMSYLWGCDITDHPNYAYGKSYAQGYHELRIDAEQRETEHDD